MSEEMDKIIDEWIKELNHKLLVKMSLKPEIFWADNAEGKDE